MKKGQKIQFTLLIIFFIVLITYMILMIFVPKHFVMLTLGFLGLLLVFSLLMVLLRSITCSYVCKNCHHEFKLNFFQDLFHFAKGKEGRFLKCPKCQEKSFMTSVYK